MVSNFAQNVLDDPSGLWKIRAILVCVGGIATSSGTSSGPSVPRVVHGGVEATKPRGDLPLAPSGGLAFSGNLRLRPAYRAPPSTAGPWK